MARVRPDVALTIAVAALIGLGAQHITQNVIEATNQPEEYRAVEITDGSTGAQADDRTVRVESIVAIKAQNGPFTLELEDRRQHQPIATTDDFYLLRLDNNEVVVARVLRDSITQRKVKETEFGSTWAEVMPIGQVVHEPVPAEVLQIAEQYYHPPDDSSFYIDMRGTHKGGYWYHPRNAKEWGENVFVIVTIILTVILWRLMVRLGLHQPLLPRKINEDEPE